MKRTLPLLRRAADRPARTPSSLDLGRLALTTLRLRDLFLVVLLVVLVVLPLDGARQFVLAAGLALVVLPYNGALWMATKRTGAVPRVMAAGDQALAAGFFLLWPEILAPAVIAGMLAIAVAAVLLDRRAAVRGAAVGGALFTAVALSRWALTDLSTEQLLVPPAYALAAMTTALVVGTVAGRERSSQRHLTELLESLQVVVYELDLATCEVRYVSPHAVTLTGRPAEHWLGDPKPFLSLVDPVDRHKLVEIEVTARDGGTHDGEYRITTPDGEHKWVRNIAAVTVDGNGRTLLRGSVADITLQKQAEQALARQARTDPLTGLENRSELLRAVARRAAASDLPQAPRLLAFLDLDSFKRVNDSLGHAAGDALLVQVAERLREVVRKDDDVARLGGDEFVVLMRLDDVADADTVVRRLLATFEEPFVVDGRPLSVTSSAGAVIVDADTVAMGGSEALLECADAAMYAAKRSGPGRFAFYSDSMRAAAVRRLDLETELRTALDSGQFFLAYQPIVRAADGSVMGYEALVRWQHPDRGLVSPADFVPVAEETGQIVELGRWILEEACAQARRWSSDRPVTMSVNLSARQLGDAHLVADVAMALHESGLPASALTLEITETALVAEPESALTTLRALRALGVTIALDDFGTGFSSLSHLHHYPVDIVKIDRSFVTGVADPHSDGRAIVAAVLGLAAHMNLRVTAEGVETEEQAAALRELGCERLQGYFFGKPAPAPAADIPAPRRGVAVAAAV